MTPYWRGGIRKALSPGREVGVCPWRTTALSSRLRTNAPIFHAPPGNVYERLAPLRVYASWYEAAKLLFDVKLPGTYCESILARSSPPLAKLKMC